MKFDMCILRTYKKCNTIQWLDFQNSHPIKNMRNLKGFSPNQFGEKPCPWQFRVQLMGTPEVFINSSIHEINKFGCRIRLPLPLKKLT